MFQKEPEGRKLEAHLEKKAAAEAVSSSSSSSSLEKTPNVVNSPEQPSVTSPDASMYAPPHSQPVITNGANGAIPATPKTTVSTKSGPTVAPSKVKPALCKEHVSSLNLKIDRATSVTPRSIAHPYTFTGAPPVHPQPFTKPSSQPSERRRHALPDLRSHLLSSASSTPQPHPSLIAAPRA